MQVWCCPDKNVLRNKTAFLAAEISLTFTRKMQTTTRLFRQFCVVAKPNNAVTGSFTLFSRARRNYSTDPQIKPQTEEFVDFKANKPADLAKFFKDLEIYPNFITEVEHDQLVAESEKAFKKKKYQNSHFDHVITGYRETEKSNWVSELCNFRKSIQSSVHEN